MIRELILLPFGTGAPGARVTWDDETGAITGEGAEHVERAIQRYEPGTSIPCLPECSGYTLSAEPRKSLPCMAVILYRHFRIPDWLMERYPEADKDNLDETDEGEDWDDDLPETPIVH